MYLKELFSTPVWATSLDSISDQDLKEIRKYCLDTVRIDPSVQYSNQGGYHSPAYSVEQLADTPLSTILKPILDHCNECMINLGSEKKLRLSSIWFHVNGPDHYNDTHAHGGVLSGTFYVYVPDNEASIFFSRALDMTNYFYGSIGCSNINGITASEFDFKPSERALVIFPSWLPHGVRPNRSNLERISISFNTELVNEQTTI
jgi:uncharacterized protein (TIGR02466 family)